MKKALVVFCLLFSFFIFGQTHVLKLQSKHSSFYKEIKENKRIKIETKEGKIFKGRFKVQDSTSIVIQDQVVVLADIVTIKKNSMFGTIANPVFITIGAGVFILGGSGLFVANPFAAIAGVIAMIGSIPIIAVPLFKYGHPSKNWYYSIIEIK
jgi:small nuclear ribonucleoprotein (snRNP)-like protein